MKLKVVVHEPEQCGFWPNPGGTGLSAPPQERASRRLHAGASALCGGQGS